MMCRHCQKCKANRPRGLCWSCYYKPGLRDQYPSTSKYGRRGVGAYSGGRITMPPAPTSARPGSPEKLAILAERARLRQALWHPDDAPLHDCPLQPVELAHAG